MSPKIISSDSYLNILSSYIIFVTCIIILLVKFEVIYQQAFAHNTHMAYPITNSRMDQLYATYRTRNSNLIRA